MKTIKCIIRLDFVPKYLIRETDGAIDKGEFLQLGAVDSLLRGDMFSGLDCMWYQASLLPLSIAKETIQRLLDLNIKGTIIKIL